MDQKGTQMSKAPILQAVGVTKAYGRVVALDGADLELFPGEVLAVVGDNGAGKSTLIKCLSGAEVPDEGQIILDSQEVSFKRPQDGRHAGIETVYQTLAVAPALDIASNLYLGREMRKKGPLGSVFRMLDGSGMRKAAKEHIAALGIGTIQNISQAVETLSGGQRQAVAVARAAAFGQKVIILDGAEVSFKRPQDGRHAGIETVYQTLAVAPALDIASNLYLGREMRKKGPLGSVFRMLDGSGMRKAAKDHIAALGIGTIQNISQAVETLSGGQRQAVAVARAAAFGQKLIILDEPTAALGVRESRQVLKLIESLRERGMPVILISHNMPQVFEVADRIQVQRLGKRAAVVTPKTHTMNDVVAIMTGAMTVEKKDQALSPVR